MFESVVGGAESVFQSIAEPERFSDPAAPNEEMSHAIRPAKPPVNTCGPQADGTIVAAGGHRETGVMDAIGKLWSWLDRSEVPKDPPTAVTGVRG